MHGARIDFVIIFHFQFGKKLRVNEREVIFCANKTERSIEWSIQNGKVMRKMQIIPSHSVAEWRHNETLISPRYSICLKNFPQSQTLKPVFKSLRFALTVPCDVSTVDCVDLVCGKKRTRQKNIEI